MRPGVVIITVCLVAVAGTIFVAARPRTDPEPERVHVADGTPQAPPGALAMPVVHGHATAPDERPRSALDRYLADDHLFETFEQLRRSTHGADLWVAHRIAFDCWYSTRDDSLIGQALAGVPFNHFEKTGPGTPAGTASGEAGSLKVTQLVATPAQAAAARELRRRCDGFPAATLASYRAALADIDDRLLHVDDVVGLATGIATHRVPATPDRLRMILASQDPVAITLLDEELADRWQRVSGKPLVRSPFGAPTPVMQLVGCDLDSECGPASRTALLGCIDDASGCDLDVHRQLMRLETPSVQQLIEDTRAQYLRAIVRGDGAIWGL